MFEKNKKDMKLKAIGWCIGKIFNIGFDVGLTAYTKHQIKKGVLK